jgi:polysaccharide export outer membrane protein
MRRARFLLIVTVGLMAAACARREQAYVIDPASGQPVAMAQASAAPPSAGGRGLFTSPPSAAMAYAPQAYAAAPAQSDAPAPLQKPVVMQYRAPPPAAPQEAAPDYAAPRYAAAGRYGPAPDGSASVEPQEPSYTLDSGDKLRVIVFGQEGISNSYLVDAGGNVNLPLIGVVPARGATPQQLARRIAARLQQGYIRAPHVSVEVEAYRPFFILGEVTTPGQYPYVADMTVEQAIAIAGGFSPRASKRTVELTRSVLGRPAKAEVPLGYAMRPGDTIVVKERWF